MCDAKPNAHIKRKYIASIRENNDMNNGIQNSTWTGGIIGKKTCMHQIGAHASERKLCNI